ncbi:MAG: 50S ribosomal protein L10 [Planctomycetaceae bacterium]
MSKVVKTMVMDEIRSRLGESRDVVVIDTSLMDGVAANKMRLALQEKGVSLLTVKNKLANRVLADAGVSGLDNVLAGPSTLVWGGEDIVELSKEMTRWAREVDKLKIKGGAVDGQGLDAAGVVELSKSPSRLELIGQIAGLILSPGARLAGALLGPGGTIAGQLKKLSGDEEGGDAAE